MIIDFDTSHLVFPRLIAIVLLIMGIAIIIRNWSSIKKSGQFWKNLFSELDNFRFWGTIVITVMYFLLMIPVGNIWPNTGLGFLICSIPYVFGCGMLYMHNVSARQVMPLAITAVVGPLLVWWLFTYIFYLTLP